MRPERSQTLVKGSTHFLQTSREAAGHALQGSGDRDHLLSKIVDDVDGEGAQWAAALTVQAVVLLYGVENVLTHGVAYFVLVVAFKPHQSCSGSRETEQARIQSNTYIMNRAGTWCYYTDEVLPSTSSTFCLMSS